MTFQIENFATIRFSVADIRASREWYRSFFGVEPIEVLEDFASFRIGGIILDLALADEKSPLSRGGSVGYWLVDDLPKAIAKAQELGGKVYRGPLRVDEVQRTIVQIIDPHGNVFGLEAEY